MRIKVTMEHNPTHAHTRHGNWRGPALLLAWPVFLLLADGFLRHRVILEFHASEWLYYAASTVLSFVAYGGIVVALRHLRQRAKHRTYLFALCLTGVLHLAILGVSYGVYFSNGNLPDLFLLSYVRCETTESLILARDSFRWHYWITLPAGLVGICGAFHWLWQHPHLGSGGMNRWKSGAAAMAGFLSLWFCWSGTASHGQCFVPLVRTPAVLAMYAYNEIKGINPLPIVLKPRTPLPVTCKLPQPEFNLLLIVNESMRRQSLGIFGYQRDTTPYLSAFAAEHPANFFPFPHAYSNSSTTLLSVPSILTGISPLQPVDLRSKAPLAWQWAEAAGMHSFCFSSHELTWCGMRPFLTSPPPDLFWDRHIEDHPLYRDLGIDDHFTLEAAVRHLRTLGDSTQPFFGVIHLNACHYPYNTRESYQHWKGSDQNLYDNTIVEADAHAGRLIETLKETGKLDQTVIIFTSDHGEGFYEHGFKAHVYCHFAETISVPLWIYLPPAFLARRDADCLRSNLSATVQNLDILPTLLDCMGAIDQPSTGDLRKPMLGHSLLRPLPPDRTVWITNTDEVLYMDVGLSSITGSKHYMMRTDSKIPKEHLFHLVEDPGEQNDLWPQCGATEQSTYRNSFLQFPIASKIMRDAMQNTKRP